MEERDVEELECEAEKWDWGLEEGSDMEEWDVEEWDVEKTGRGGAELRVGGGFGVGEVKVGVQGRGGACWMA